MGRHYAAHTAAIGDKVHLSHGRGAAGLCQSMLPEPAAEILLLGGGNAISPLMSILRESLETGKSSRKMTLIYSAADSAGAVDSPLGQELVQLQQQHSAQLVVVPTLTQQPAGVAWGGRRGRVNPELLLPYAERCMLFFVCGGPDFVTAMVNMLLALGVWPARIRSDYAPAPPENNASAAPREKRRQLRKVRDVEPAPELPAQKCSANFENVLPTSMSSALAHDERLPGGKSKENEQTDIKHHSSIDRASKFPDRIGGPGKPDLLQKRAAATVMEESVQKILADRRKKGNSYGSRVPSGMLLHMDPVSMKQDPRSVQMLRAAPRRHQGPTPTMDCKGGWRGQQQLHYSMAPRPPRPGSAKATSVPLFTI